MQISGLNHFNIVTPDLEGTARFYESLGLKRGARPDFGNTGIWLFVRGKPIIHLNLESEVGPVVHGRGIVHHLGLDVHGTQEDVEASLKALGIEYAFFPKPVGGWFKALYFKDPNGVEIEMVLKDCYMHIDLAYDAPIDEGATYANR